MTINEYQKLAMTTCNKDMDQREMLINGAMGLCGEAGEVIDLIKKHLANRTPLDLEHTKKEMGDVMWYMAELATVLGFSLEEVLVSNIEKLKKRYPRGFSYDRAIHRAEDDI